MQNRLSSGSATSVEAEWLPHFVDALRSWKELRGVARDAARDIIEDAMLLEPTTTIDATPEKLEPLEVETCVLELLRRRPEPSLYEYLARVWVAAHPEWTETLRPWAAARGHAVWDSSRPRPPGLRSLSAVELDRAVTTAPSLPVDDKRTLRRLVLEIVLVHPEANPVDTKTATPHPAPARPATSTPLPPALQRCLEELAACEADAPEWPALDAFVLEVRQLRDEKLASGTKLKERAEVAGLIARVIHADVHAALETAQLFHIDERLKWTAHAFAGAPLAEVREAVERVLSLVSSLPALSLQPGLTREEFRRRQQAKLAIDAELSDLCDALDSLALKAAAVPALAAHTATHTDAPSSTGAGSEPDREPGRATAGTGAGSEPDQETAAVAAPAVDPVPVPPAASSPVPAPAMEPVAAPPIVTSAAPSEVGVPPPPPPESAPQSRPTAPASSAPSEVAPAAQSAEEDEAEPVDETLFAAPPPPPPEALEDDDAVAPTPTPPIAAPRPDVLSADALRAQLDALESDIEQAFIDGAIGPERSEYLDETTQLQALLEDGDNLEEVFAGARSIALSVRRARQSRLDALRAQWVSLQEALETRSIGVERVAARVEAVLESSDLRRADALLTHVRQVVAGERDFNAQLFDAPTHQHHFERFLDRIGVYESMLGRTRGKDLAQALEAANGTVPSGARQQMKWVLESWAQLEDSKAHPQRATEALAEILAFIGFEVPERPVHVGPPKGAHFRAKVSTRGQSPLPEYGSRLEGAPFDVICFFQRPGGPLLREVVAQYPTDDAGRLIVYLGRMSKADRQLLRGELKKSSRAAIVLDEWMLYFLELYAANERMRAFLDAALPWTHINPYAPKGGALAPELFVGREALAASLMEVGGACVLSGGRQTGKTALLDQAHRRASDKAKGSFAIRLDLGAVGEGAALFIRLRDELKSAGLLSASVTPETPSAILDALHAALEEKRARLLVLLDDADRLVEADAKAGFSALTALRDAMTRAGGRLKVVIAGLRDVQRLQGAGSPSASRLGPAAVVGALEPDSALELIRRPFEALGFRFQEGAGALLRILSCTNCHPGLLQLFCHHLLEHLHGDTSVVPYSVLEQDVEEVYQRKEVRDGILEQFVSTLSLDPQYRALVYSAVHAQRRDDTSHSKALSADEFLEAGRVWWKAAFDGIELEAVRRLLEEMVGLGVLASAGPERYRLRSPNVVRLLGSREEVDGALKHLSSPPPPPAGAGLSA